MNFFSLNDYGNEKNTLNQVIRGPKKWEHLTKAVIPSPSNDLPHSPQLTIIIPAAGKGYRMSTTLLAGEFDIPKALLEVGRHPVILEIINTLERWVGILKPEYRIVTGIHGAKLRTFLRNYYRGTSMSKRMRFYHQQNPTGPLSAVLAAKVHDGSILIWLCDTLLTGPNLPKFQLDTIYTATVHGKWDRWCLAEANSDGTLSKLIDKPLKNNRGQAAEALIGVYIMQDAKLFHKYGQQVLRKGLRRHGEFQLSSALTKYNTQRALRLLRVSDWQDAGSPESFAQAKQGLLERLDGHRLILDWPNHMVRKELIITKNKIPETLRAEAYWYRKMPQINPAILDSIPQCVKLDGRRLSLPYRDWPSLSDWYLYRSLYQSQASTDTFGDFLNFVRSKLHGTAKNPETEQTAQANWRMLVEKTELRLKALGNGPWSHLNLRLNGNRIIGSWPQMRRSFRDMAARYAMTSEQDWRTIHGDLVFSNVLADGRGHFHLVDPRGSYGGKLSVYGNRYYDYAKIAQCVFSKYDLIKKDEFVLRSRTSHDFELNFPKANLDGRKHWPPLFLDFCRSEGLDIKRLRFFEASLLLSLLPLHKENPHQVLAAYLTGLDILRILAQTK